MLSHICKHEQARQILDPCPFQFFPHAWLIINKILRVEQFADDDHRFIVTEACSPRCSLVCNSSRNYKANMLSVILLYIYGTSLFKKYEYTYTCGCNCATAIRVENNRTALCCDCTSRRGLRCAKVPSAVIPDLRRIVSLEPPDLKSDQTHR